MEEYPDKKSPNRLIRRPVRSNSEESYWDCSVCTYRNGSEAFKCGMCDVRKGTSTRKPRLNSQLVAQQVAQQYSPTPAVIKKTSSKRLMKKMRPRLKNVDRSSAQHMAVTVGSVTVIITDYKLLEPERSPSGTPDGNSPLRPDDTNHTDIPTSSIISNNNSVLSDGGSREEDST